MGHFHVVPTSKSRINISICLSEEIFFITSVFSTVCAGITTDGICILIKGQAKTEDKMLHKIMAYD
jgi:hypothetical protein